MKPSWKTRAQVGVVLLSALALKQFYSMAGPNQLRWVLAPTTACVQLLSGTRFTFESNAGYMSADHSFLIAAACAGVNFLLASFLMFSLQRLWKSRRREVSWKFLPIAAVSAYVVTIAANTVRIVIALILHNNPPNQSWFNPQEIHRMEGVLVYFGFLLFVFVLGESERSRTAKQWVHLSVFPLSIYYFTTLLLPFANGASRRGGFWQHSAFVFVVPLIVIGVIGLLVWIKSWLQRQAFRFHSNSIQEMWWR